MATLASLRVPSIYPSLMSRRGHGYPLWLPEPISNLPHDCVRHGTQIGDLGYLADDGGFTYLFNVFKDAEDPVNLDWHSVPPGFVPLKVDPGIRQELEFHDKNSVVAMSGVEQRSAGVLCIFSFYLQAGRFDCVVVSSLRVQSREAQSSPFPTVPNATIVNTPVYSGNMQLRMLTVGTSITMAKTKAWRFATALCTLSPDATKLTLGMPSATHTQVVRRRSHWPEYFTTGRRDTSFLVSMNEVMSVR